MFFFSSRRRHTRWTGDWSSDVCSSDLGQRNQEGMAAIRAVHGEHARVCAPAPRTCAEGGSTGRGGVPPTVPSLSSRSEERRVGKECRAGRAAESWTKNKTRKRDDGTQN